MNLSEECFREHVAGSAFQLGIERDWWGLVPDSRVLWPHALLWLKTAPRPEPDGPAARFHLRFLLQDYPRIGPTASCWDAEANAKAGAEKRPKGAGNVAIAFRVDWKAGDTLYVPWDRIAMDDHGDWPTKYPGYVWKSTHTIVTYLNHTRALLESADYHGI